MGVIVCEHFCVSVLLFYLHECLCVCVIPYHLYACLYVRLYMCPLCLPAVRLNVCLYVCLHVIPLRPTRSLSVTVLQGHHPTEFQFDIICRFVNSLLSSDRNTSRGIESKKYNYAVVLQDLFSADAVNDYLIKWHYATVWESELPRELLNIFTSISSVWVVMRHLIECVN